METDIEPEQQFLDVTLALRGMAKSMARTAMTVEQSEAADFWVKVFDKALKPEGIAQFVQSREISALGTSSDEGKSMA